MTSLALRSLLARKLRAVLTALAVVIGISMISGSLVLTDTIQRAFSNIFETAVAGSDVVVSGDEPTAFSASGPPTVPASVAARISALDGVEAATGRMADDVTVKLTDLDGDSLSTGGSPTITFGVDTSPAVARFNQFRLESGAWASGSGQAVIDAGTAERGRIAIGDRISAVGTGGPQQLTVTGIATFAGARNLGGAAMAILDVPSAQALLGKSGFDEIAVAGKPGVDDAELARAVASVVPDGTQVQTASAAADESKGEISEGLGFIRNFLLAFAGVALLVGAFVIFNTMSITVAQRTRELATLRTLGASRRQVRRAVVLEGAVIGLVGSAVGLLAGIGLARGLNALFKGAGLDLPQAAAVIAPRTIIVSLLVGTLVTVVASLVPAMRATRVPPIAAVREGAVLSEAHPGRRRAIAPIAAIAGVALTAWSVLGSLETRPRLVLLAAGLVVLFVGVGALLPRVVAPIARLVGAPSARFAGEAGRLGRENAMRNPGRTAATSAALMVGIALIALVASLGQGLRSAETDALRSQVTATHVVAAEDGFSNLPQGVAAAASNVAGVEIATGVRQESAVAGSDDVTVSGVDPATIGSVASIERGTGRTVSQLADGEAIVSTAFAKDRGLAVGGVVELRTPQRETLTLEVSGTYRASRFDSVFGPVIVSHATFDRAFQRPSNALTLVRASGDAARVATDLTAATTSFPDAAPKTLDSWIADRAAQINTFLNLLYVLLGLSVVVSLFGMLTTLALSVFERTRELGMLRAVGLSRRQTRRAVRHESIVVALIGAAVGLPLGIGLAGLVTFALRDFDVPFSLPTGSIVVITLVAIVCGILAAVGPARRASRLDIVDALRQA